MTRLEAKTQRLVELGRHGHDPSAQDVDHLWAALSGKLGATSTAAGTAAAGKTAGVSLGAKAALLVAPVLASVGVAWLVARTEPVVDAPRPAPAAVAPAPEPQESAPATSAQVRPESAVMPRKPPPASTTAKVTRAPRLQEEAALLAGVQRALRSGQPSSALAELDRYDREFGGGALRAEADAARVLALCAALQRAQARAAAKRFVQRYPKSPSAARVRDACR